MAVRERLLQLLSGGPKSLSELSKSFTGSDRILIEPILSELADAGQVIVKQLGRERAFALAHPQAENRASELAKDVPFQIVATLPESVWSSKPDISSTKSAIQLVMRETKKELVVIQPFIDPFFVEVFSEDLRALAERGCRVVLLTRKIDIGSDAQRAILQMYEVFATRRILGGALEVHEHWYPFHRGFGRDLQFIGLHAKVVMNEEEAYVGSANWTEYSLSNNVEVGVLVRDSPLLQKLRELLFLVVTNSKTVDLAKMHQNALDRTKRR